MARPAVYCGFAYFPAHHLLLTERSCWHHNGKRRKTLLMKSDMLSAFIILSGVCRNTQCPLNADCTTDGDLVCDTDPIFNNYNSGTSVFSFACRTGNNACAGGIPYTINTESNFMSYTNCYTLFTNDQKARTQAALALPSRASLVDPGNLALTPCGTTINFTQATATLLRLTGTLTVAADTGIILTNMTIGARQLQLLPQHSVMAEPL